MATHKLSGDDVVLMIGTSAGSEDTIVCLTSNGITRATNEIDAKTKCGPDKLPGTQEITVNFEGQIVYDSADVSLEDLFTWWESKTTIYWKMGPASPVTGDITFSGSGFISALDDTYAMDSPGTFSGSIGVYGNMSMNVTS